jgi:hypothetical protein
MMCAAVAVLRALTLLLVNASAALAGLRNWFSMDANVFRSRLWTASANVFVVISLLLGRSAPARGVVVTERLGRPNDLVLHGREVDAVRELAAPHPTCSRTD